MRCPWTQEELEAMRLAEIEQEFAEQYAVEQSHKEMDAWLDELSIRDLMDHKSYHRRKKKKQYSAAYYEAHREEIAAKQAAYREAHREEYDAYMREYMREYKKGRRRKEKQIVETIQALSAGA